MPRAMWIDTICINQRTMRREQLRLDGWLKFMLGLRKFWSGVIENSKRESRAGEIDLLN